MPAVRVVDEHLLSPVLVYSGSGGAFQNELILDAQGGIVREQIGNLLVVKNDFDVVAALTGSVFTGPVSFLNGASGSIQTLSDGSPFIRSGAGIEVMSGSDGSITIASTIDTSSFYAGGMLTELVLNEKITGTIDGVNSVFELINNPATTNSVMIWLNGQLITSGQDYNIAGKVITFVEPPQQDDILLAMYSKAATVKHYALNEPVTYENVLNNPVLKLGRTPEPPSSLMLFRNGQLLTKDTDFSLSSKTISAIDWDIDPTDIYLATYSYVL